MWPTFLVFLLLDCFVSAFFPPVTHYSSSVFRRNPRVAASSARSVRTEPRSLRALTRLRLVQLGRNRFQNKNVEKINITNPILVSAFHLPSCSVTEITITTQSHKLGLPVKLSGWTFAEARLPNGKFSICCFNSRQLQDLTLRRICVVLSFSTWSLDSFHPHTHNSFTIPASLFTRPTHDILPSSFPLCSWKLFQLSQVKAWEQVVR